MYKLYDPNTLRYVMLVMSASLQKQKEQQNTKL